MQWACERCGTVHTQTPSECRTCEATAFRPARPGELPDSDADSPDPITPGETQTYGTTPDPDYESSPDVATDGSVERTVKPERSDAGQRDSRVGPWLRRRWRTAVATLRAPIGLLREFLIPILAFVFVILAVWWLFA